MEDPHRGDLLHGPTTDPNLGRQHRCNPGHHRHDDGFITELQAIPQDAEHRHPVGRQVIRQMDLGRFTPKQQILQCIGQILTTFQLFAVLVSKPREPGLVVDRMAVDQLLNGGLTLTPIDQLLDLGVGVIVKRLDRVLTLWPAAGNLPWRSSSSHALNLSSGKSMVRRSGGLMIVSHWS